MTRIIDAINAKRTHQSGNAVFYQLFIMGTKERWRLRPQKYVDLGLLIKRRKKDFFGENRCLSDPINNSRDELVIGT